MNISYNWLRDLIELRLPPGELRERLTMRGLEVEALHAVGNDWVLEVAVLSNRPDLLSHLGVAREVAVMTDATLRLPATNCPTSAGRTESFTAVEIQAPELCPRYAARVVRGVAVGPSPAWLVQRLEAVGQRSINNIADITNYVMLELGQPLHAFDLDRLTERRIVVRRAHEGEQLRTLDGVARALDPAMLVIADAARAVALAGVMGGADSEISATTRDVLIESAYFTPAAVRHTARALEMQTDASDRFERGTDYEGVVRALARAVALICELAGGTPTEDALDVYPQRLHAPVVSLRLSRIGALTGLPVAPADALRILTALGCTPVDAAPGGGPVAASASGLDAASAASGPVAASDGAPAHEVVAAAAGVGAPAAEALAFAAPSWRTDIKIEADLIEEVGRHFGYEHVGEELPAAHTVGEYRAHEFRRRAARAALIAGGYDEAISFSFIAAAHDEQFELLPAMTAPTVVAEPFVTLRNPIIEGAARMRPTLLPGLLAAVRHNFNHGSRDVCLFETGRIFAAKPADAERPRERDACALVLTGGLRVAASAATVRELDFYDLKGALEALLAALHVADVEFAAAAVPHLRAGQAAEVRLHAERVGTVGRLADDLAAAYKFRQPVYVAEVDFSALLAAAVEPTRYTPLPRFPSVVRDVTLVVDRRTAFADLQRAVRALQLAYCRSLELVYVYEGERVPAGQRSITLRLEYRAPDRTLRDEEVDELHAQVVAALTPRV